MIYNFLLFDISLLPIGLMINTTLYNKYALKHCFLLTYIHFFTTIYILNFSCESYFCQKCENP